MKKTAGKIILFIVCLALVIFLLLPFLQTSDRQPASNSAVKTAEPQIFTSNPLTALVNRIARFFSRKQASSSPKTLTSQQEREHFGSPVPEEELYADARAASLNSISTEAAPQAGSGPRADFGDASLQTDEGEWVLIRQTMPEDGVRGMHEISTKDNPYDRYVRQERAARFTPAAAPASPQVPDSKWARLFNPIKRLFGFSAPQAVASRTADGTHTGSGSRLASSDGIGPSRGKQASSFGGGEWNMPQPGALNPQDGQAADGQTPLLAYLDPNAVLDEIADSLADAQYPNPQNAQDKKAKEDYRQQRREEAQQYFLSRAQERLNRLAAGQEAEDELKNMLSFSCTNEAPRPVKSSVCSVGENPNARPASKQALNAAKTKNAQSFLKKTHVSMPPAPITPIIGKATGIPQDTIDPDFESAEYKKTMEIYQFMMQQEDCSSKPCYWVANSRQLNTELSDSVEAAGAVLKGDPLDKYSQVAEQFAQYKLEQLPADATEEEKKAVQTQADQFAPSYILYTTDNLKSVQEQNREAMRERNMQGGAALYALTAPIGKQLSEDLDSTVFFYGRDDAFIDADKNPTFVERSAVLTDTLADQIQFFQQIGQELRRKTSREIVQKQTRAEVEAIQKKSQKERAAFDKKRAAAGMRR